MAKKKVEAVDKTNKVEEVKEVKKVKKTPAKKTTKTVATASNCYSDIESGVEKGKKSLEEHAKELAEDLNRCALENTHIFNNYKASIAAESHHTSLLLNSIRTEAKNYSDSINNTVNTVTDLVNSLKVAYNKTKYHKIGFWTFAIVWLISLILNVCGVVAMPWFWVFFPLMLAASASVVGLGIVLHYIHIPFNKLLNDENINIED